MKNYFGYLKYQDQKLIVDVDDNFAKFYRSLIPKYFNVNPTRYTAHISVVRNEVPKNPEVWNKYQNKKIDFIYDNFIYNDEIYWWLNVFSTELESIRVELGLENHSWYTLPPSGFNKCFHLTIGNTKNR